MPGPFVRRERVRYGGDLDVTRRLAHVQLGQFSGSARVAFLRELREALTA